MEGNRKKITHKRVFLKIYICNFGTERKTGYLAKEKEWGGGKDFYSEN